MLDCKFFGQIGPTTQFAVGNYQGAIGVDDILLSLGRVT